MPAETETRRGLKVIRPKGKPFSYTVERNGGEGIALMLKIMVGDCGWESITVAAPAEDGRPMHAEVWHDGGCYYSTDTAIPERRLELAEDFAAALSWAVRYARRWNAKHLKTEAAADAPKWDRPEGTDGGDRLKRDLAILMTPRPQPDRCPMAETIKVRFPAAIAPDGRWAVAGFGQGSAFGASWEHVVSGVLDDVDHDPRSSVRVVTVEVELPLPVDATVKGAVSDAP